MKIILLDPSPFCAVGLLAEYVAFLAPAWADSRCLSDNRQMQRVSPVILYTASRIGIFVACLGLLYLVGMHGILLIAVGFVVSGLLSFVLLNRQRDAMSAFVTERAARMRQRFNERLTAEDVDDEAVDDDDGARGSGEREADSEKDGEGKL
jgi:Protein of unknown function (DUF4229)